MLSARPLRTSSAVTRRARNLWSRGGRAFVWLACLGFAVNLLAALLLHLEAWLDQPTLDRRANLPNYQEVDWAKTHFREFAELVAVHHSYVGWRRLRYRGETIEIGDDGIRRTYADPAVKPTKTIAFFGGSTMWGSGSDDERTIPSAFAKAHPQYRAINLGETAHAAHQNLNALLQVLAGGLEPDVVVFYNGSSEINKCRVGLSAFSTTDEPQIRQLLEPERREFAIDRALSLVFHPLEVFSKSLRGSLEARLFGSTSRRDCSDDPAKAQMIARVLIWDWLAAKHLVEGYGGRFVAALQPVAYFSRTRKDHIEIDQDLQRQYQAVYAAYDALLPDFPALESNLLDLRGAFDRDEYIYIDADHAGPNGNAIIATAIGAFVTR